VRVRKSVIRSEENCSILLSPDIASHDSAILALRPCGNRHEAHASEVAEPEFRSIGIADDGSLRRAGIS
jgi:hypothetical protein